MTQGTSSNHTKPIVAVAGATGFIGTALASPLAARFHLVGLTRSERTTLAGYDEVRTVDLFSQSDTMDALRGVDFAVYLVHSMMPSARLVQADFDDLDLLCADNFAQAAAQQGVKHIVYVGGLQPSGTTTSTHLKSRQEVEDVLGSHGVPVTTLRAGMIVGGNGSSFQILTRLVARLPVMVCPSWTKTSTHPVALRDVVWAISETIDRPGQDDQVFDLGASDSCSYRELMAKTAELMGKERHFFGVPLVKPGFSALWISLVTGAPGALVKPLIASLRYEMLARTDPRFRLKGEPRTSIEDTLRAALSEPPVRDEPRAFRGATRRPKPVVLSVQRMQLPAGVDADWAASEYIRWLPNALGSLLPLRAVESDGDVSFKVFRHGPTLLKIARQPERVNATFDVVGGALATAPAQGQLEFRTVLDGRTLIVAVHRFVPRLPWWIYRSTQALVHAWVMARFAKHLGRLSQSSPSGSLRLRHVQGI